MSIVAESKCAVGLRTDDGQAAPIIYDRATIELRLDENTNCFLRGIDNGNKNKV